MSILRDLNLLVMTLNNDFCCGFRIDANTTVIQSRLSILENSDIGEEATAKVMEAKRRIRYLEKHITMQEEEIQASTFS